MMRRLWVLVLAILSVITFVTGFGAANELGLLLKDFEAQFNNSSISGHGGYKSPAQRCNITFSQALGKDDLDLLDNNVELGVALNPNFDLVLGGAFDYDQVYCCEFFEVFGSVGGRYKFFQHCDFNSYLYGSVGLGYRQDGYFTSNYKKTKAGIGFTQKISDRFGVVGEAGLRCVNYSGEPFDFTNIASTASLGLRYYF